MPSYKSTILDDLREEFGDNFPDLSEKEIIGYVISKGKESWDIYTKKKNNTLLTNGKDIDLKKTAECAYISGSKNVLKHCIDEMSDILPPNTMLAYRVLLEDMDKHKNLKDRIEHLKSPTL